MKPTTKLKIIGTFFGIILILNMILAAMMLINWMVFWGVLIVVAAISYWGIPWLKRKWLSQPPAPK